jgi:glycosyltransferase involved in cell wall biosynthesis
MAVYNTPRYFLELSINSILNQTFTDFEFVIIDDGSEKFTRNVLERFASNDSRIVLCKQKKNVGLTRALNIGLKVSRGNYIVRQDADDFSMPTRLAITLAFMDENEGVAAAGTYVDLIDSTGKKFGIIKPDLRKLQKRNVLIHGSMIFRKDCLTEVGGYNKKMYFSQDYEIFLRMIRVHNMRLDVVPKKLYALRQHSESISSKKLFQQFYFSVLAKVITLPARPIWRRKFDFLMIYLFDFIVTHRLLGGSIFRYFLKYFLTKKNVKNKL